MGSEFLVFLLLLFFILPWGCLDVLRAIVRHVKGYLSFFLCDVAQGRIIPKGDVLSPRKYYHTVETQQEEETMQDLIPNYNNIFIKYN